MAYCQLQIEGGVVFPITCTHVEQVFGIPPSWRKLVLDTYRHRDGRVPSIQKIERLMVETENAKEFHQFFIIFACVIVLAPTLFLEGHHALWHATAKVVTGDAN